MIMLILREKQSATSASPSPTRRPSQAAPSVTPPVNLSIVLCGLNISSISSLGKAILIRCVSFSKWSFCTVMMYWLLGVLELFFWLQIFMIPAMIRYNPNNDFTTNPITFSVINFQKWSFNLDFGITVPMTIINNVLRVSSI